MAIVVAVGSSSRSTSNRLGPISTFNVVTPVRLPPGRFRLATSPSLTGSPPVRKTIGIVAVAAFEAVAATMLLPVAITFTGRLTRSAARVLAIGPAVFDDHIPALNVARFVKAKAERAHY